MPSHPIRPCSSVQASSVWMTFPHHYPQSACTLFRPPGLAVTLRYSLGYFCSVHLSVRTSSDHCGSPGRAPGICITLASSPPSIGREPCNLGHRQDLGMLPFLPALPLPSSGLLPCHTQEPSFLQEAACPGNVSRPAQLRGQVRSSL